MAFSMSRFSTLPTDCFHVSQNSSSIPPPIIRSPQFRYNYCYKSPRFCYKLKCYAAAKQERSGGSSTAKKRKKTSGKNSIDNSIEDDFVIGKTGGGGRVEVLESPSLSENTALLLPKPPAGFVLDEGGRVLKASSKRVATIVDSTNNSSLECVIRRIFRNSQGDECMLLCPVDTPVQILKSVNVEGWSAVSDEEVVAILPTAAYALAKIHMHLVYSGYDEASTQYLKYNLWSGIWLEFCLF